MAEYYFDIETYSPKERPDPETDKIITIQFQRINLQVETAYNEGELIILKEWESSEEEIVTQFFNQFFRDGLNIWNFVPVGFNLNFEWEFLISKFEEYLDKKFTSKDLHYKIPHIDLKSIIVLLNGGKFRGASLDKFTDKPHDGKLVKEWYEKKQYDKIEQYVRDEAKSFLDFLQKIRKNIHKVLE